jgi:tetratricopeptide (TPR) repeat protein
MPPRAATLSAQLVNRPASRPAARANRPVAATGIALAALLAIAGGSPIALTSPTDAGSSTVIGPSNVALSDGAAALADGRFDEGIRLTLEGLRGPSSIRDQAAGHSNLCAGYASLRRWTDALPHCEEALRLDGQNWRTFNNRAAIRVARGEYDAALEDLRRGLELAPQSDTLQKSLQIALTHKKAHQQRKRSAVRA